MTWHFLLLPCRNFLTLSPRSLAFPSRRSGLLPSSVVCLLFTGGLSFFLHECQFIFHAIASNKPRLWTASGDRQGNIALMGSILPGIGHLANIVVCPTFSAPDNSFPIWWATDQSERGSLRGQCVAELCNPGKRVVILPTRRAAEVDILRVLESFFFEFADDVP